MKTIKTEKEGTEMKKTIIILTGLLVLALSGYVLAAPVIEEIYYQKTTTLTYPKKYTFRFSLWNDPSSTDPSAMVWSEEKQITLTSPKIKTYLGDTNSLSGVDFSQQLYVQVERKKADGTYVVIGTRERFTIVPYAFSFQTPLTITDEDSNSNKFLLWIINNSKNAIKGTSNSDGTGVMGETVAGRGIYGRAAGSGIGVYGYSADPSGYAGYFVGGAGVYVSGDLYVSGTKPFVQPHPRDPSKEIVYIAMEAPESAVMIRGTARLIDGKAVIETPEHFRMVASSEGITVQFTPRSSKSKGLAAVEVSRDRVVVEELMDGKGTYEFDYFITAKRAGFEGHEPVQPNKHFSADMKTKEEFERRYQSKDMATIAIKRMLISNGILTEDGRLNMETVRKLGWIIKDADIAKK